MGPTYSIVANKTRSRSTMNNWSGLGTQRSESVDVSHDIVSGFLFFFRSHLEVNIKNVIPHLFKLHFGDIDILHVKLL
jgi:hypothetical protein